MSPRPWLAAQTPTTALTTVTDGHLPGFSAPNGPWAAEVSTGGGCLLVATSWSSRAGHVRMAGSVNGGWVSFF